jgi:hypothetical protein
MKNKMSQKSLHGIYQAFEENIDKALMLFKPYMLENIK